MKTYKLGLLPTALLGIASFILMISLIGVSELLAFVVGLCSLFLLSYFSTCLHTPMSGREAVRVSAFLIAILVFLLAISKVFSADTVSEAIELVTSGELLLDVVAWTLLCGFLFFLVPMLIWKMRHGERHVWGFPTDALQSGSYVFRKLRPEVADRTTEGELIHLLALHNPIPLHAPQQEIAVSVIDFYMNRIARDSRIQKEDIPFIIALRDEYKKHENIVLPPGYQQKIDLVPVDFR